MGKAIKCQACGSFYNGATYSDCPYCSAGVSKQNTAAIAQKEETKRIFGIFGKKNSVEKASAINPPEVVNKDKEKSEELVIAAESDAGTDPLVQLAEVRQTTESAFRNMEQIIPETQPLMFDKQTMAAKAETNDGLSLSQAISRSGRTVGKYISNSGGESIAPVVGWLVGIRGAYHGQSFNLKSGRNKVGRSHEMDVKLLNDESVSRSSVAVIIFDAKAGEFSILPGESDSLCYVNNKAVYERVVLSGYEEIEFGDAELNKYMFVPFCGERFSWTDYSNK